MFTISSVASAQKRAGGGIKISGNRFQAVVIDTVLYLIW